MTVDISEFLDPYSDSFAEQWKAITNLTDELNSLLPEYRVSLEHYDAGDFLRFERRSTLKEDECES